MKTLEFGIFTDMPAMRWMIVSSLRLKGFHHKLVVECSDLSIMANREHDDMTFDWIDRMYFLEYFRKHIQYL
jgi:hypothetical protein